VREGKRRVTEGKRRVREGKRRARENKRTKTTTTANWVKLLNVDMFFLFV